MEIQLVAPIAHVDEVQNIEDGEKQFILANTIGITPSELKTSCIIPSFAKDNESTISHTHFIESIYLAAQTWFKRESILEPIIRVSHPVKGRIPCAMGKPAKLLSEDEKTLYYERMAFFIEIPSIRDTINGNELNLTLGGVRAYNLENLYSRKVEEKFKIFIGFNNKVCLNLCVSSDGFVEELRARTASEIIEEAFKLFSNYNAPQLLKQMATFESEFLTDQQFAQLLGRSRMYQHLPQKIKREIPSIMPLSDTQVSIVTKSYYNDESFAGDSLGGISLWKLFNLFTGANKSSYIDTFIDRGVGSHTFISDLYNSLNVGKYNWFLQ